MDGKALYQLFCAACNSVGGLAVVQYGDLRQGSKEYWQAWDKMAADNFSGRTQAGPAHLEPRETYDQYVECARRYDPTTDNLWDDYPPNASFKLAWIDMTQWLNLFIPSAQDDAPYPPSSLPPVKPIPKDAGLWKQFYAHKPPFDVDRIVELFKGGKTKEALLRMYSALTLDELETIIQSIGHP